MFENERMTRAAICGTGLLLAAVFLFAGLPIVLLVIPVAVIFLGLVADPEETHAVWYGMLFVLCVFEVPALTEAEKENYAVKRHYFWFGEVGMATILAGLFAVPSGYWLAGRTDPALAVIGAGVVFLPLFVFLPKVLLWAMRADVDAAIDAFGKNEHVRNVFWAVFVAVAGLVLARIVDPATAQEIVRAIAG
ncbi:MAG: hypothetical protein WAU64_09440 [Methanoregula sp.]|uniref:hypothetical protein n=1 Tax=Methanoregula sp. TaxID=2052170 RepID=UPI003BB0659E